LEKKSISINWIDDKHRTHPWSLRPGGCTVVVIYSNNHCRGYDKVKRPHRYLQQISRDYISNYTSNERITKLEDYIDKLYAAKEGSARIILVWNKNKSSSPWDELSKYATE
jgi:hypothetical protein